MWDVCYQLIGKIDRVREAKMTKFSITVGTLKDNDVFKIGSRMTEGTPESKTWFNYMLDCLVEEGYIKSHNGYGSVTVS